MSGEPSGLLKKVQAAETKSKTKGSVGQEIDAAVTMLIRLKSEYKAVTGQDWKPGTTVSEVPAEVVEQFRDINENINNQVKIIRSLKSLRVDDALGDSSGEEDDMKTYDIRTKIIAFKVATEENDVLSFIAHAAGVYAFYSPAVQTKYNALKESFLPDPVGENLTSEQLTNPKFDLTNTSEADFVVLFLSHLRLHNRSEKRCLKQDEDVDDECRNTSWKFFDGKDVIRLNNKNCYKGCRNEQVYFGDKCYERYSNFLRDLSQDDKDFLLETRANLMKVSGKINRISNRFLTLWYLFFGCEFIKNPAALIHHNMAFDLISGGKFEWGEDMINNIPMLSPGSIREAMALNNHYTNFMPHTYLYQSRNNYSFEKLVEREAAITKKWLELKLGIGISTYLINQCKAGDNDGRAAEALWLKIMESFEGWGLSAVKHPDPVAV